MHLARRVMFLLAGLSIFALSGCMSLATTFDNDPEVDSKVFIGTRTNLDMAASPFSSKMDSEGKGMMIGALPFILVDIPLSFVMDTLLLPYTAQYIAPPHPVVGYGIAVSLEGQLTEFSSTEHMLQLRPSIYISQEGIPLAAKPEAKVRTFVIQLVLNEALAAEYAKLKNRVSFDQHVVVDGVLSPPAKNGYASLTVTAFRLVNEPAKK